MRDVLSFDNRTAIERAARKLCPEGSTIDALAKDRDDYVSELTSVFFKARDKFQIRCPDAADDGAYAYKSLWNHVAEVRRLRSRRLGPALHDWDPDEDADIGDLEEQTHHRELLSLVKRRVSPRQWELLQAYAEAGGSIAETHRGADWGVGVGYFRQQVRDAQEKAQQILVGAGFRLKNLDSKSGLIHDRDMVMSRKELEREADRLGVVWTYATTDNELRMLVKLGGQRMESGADEGAGMESAHKCFGLYWDVPQEEACQTCDGRVECLEKFAKETVPEKQIALGGSPTLAELARSLEVSDEAIDCAVAHAAQQRVAESGPEESGSAEVVAEDVQSDDVGDTAAGGGSNGIAAATEVPEQDIGPSPKSHLSLVPPEPVDELETDVMEKKKATKKKVTKKVTKKAAAAEKVVVKKKAAKKKAAKKAPTRKVKASSPPRKAEAAKPAAVSAKSKAKRASSAKSVTERGEQLKCRQKDPWGKHTWVKRHNREKTNPLIARLSPGMTVRREFNGQMHEVRVLKHSYRYAGEEYPTLYSVVKKIAGTQQAPRQLTKDGKRPEGHRQLCNWSAPKFFNLAALFRP
jgi:outer membrane biosynthesis protein TonB